MKKLFSCFIVLLFALFAFCAKANADCTFEADGRTITFVEDESKNESKNILIYMLSELNKIKFGFINIYLFYFINILY